MTKKKETLKEVPKEEPKARTADFHERTKAATSMLLAMAATMLQGEKLHEVNRKILESTMEIMLAMGLEPKEPIEEMITNYNAWVVETRSKAGNA